MNFLGLRGVLVAFAFALVAVATSVACPAPGGGEGEGEGTAGEGEGAAGEGEGAALVESEPNDGAASADEVNALPVAATMTGAIGSAGDADVFKVDTVPGALYRVVLTATATAGAPLLDGHLTVLDAGRGGHAAGADYARLERAPDGPDASVFFMAFGIGGDLVVVRDTHALGGGAGAGGAGFTYSLVVTEVDTGGGAAAAPVPLVFPSTTTGSLTEVGGVMLYSFTAVNGADFTVDLTADGDLDARLFVYADSQQDWIARNDDRAIDNKDPRLDAFFPVGGPMLLVVESAAETASNLGFSLTTTGNAP